MRTKTMLTSVQEAINLYRSPATDDSKLRLNQLIYGFTKQEFHRYLIKTGVKLDRDDLANVMPSSKFRSVHEQQDDQV